jgi:hypothetical protein
VAGAELSSTGDPTLGLQVVALPLKNLPGLEVLSVVLGISAALRSRSQPGPVVPP